MANQRKIFSSIYDKYVNKIYRFIFIKVSSQEIAEDLCSETFLRGWQVFKERRDIENPPAFLYQIARNLVIDHYREKGKAKIVSAEYWEVTDPHQNLEEKSLLGSDIDNIRIVLASLREEYQDVIIWHYLDGLTFSEMGRILNKSENAVRVQTHRALKELRKKLIRES
ncbi:MAG: RNA polymerase sigma factor [Candidatus Nealsonbacteria bacterium]